LYLTFMNKLFILKAEFEFIFVKIKNVNFLIRDGSVTDVLSHSRKILASSSLNDQFL